MALSIISNQAANVASRNLGAANEAAANTAEQLSTGRRVNSAADDAAASAISARLTSEVSGLQQAGVNAGQASSLLQIADGAFQNVEDILTRAKSLSVQAGSDQLSNQEREFLDQEFQALKTEIDRIADDTEFNGTKLVNGDVAAVGGDGASNASLTMLATVNGMTQDASLGAAATAISGVQGFQAMGLSLANVGNTTNRNVVDSNTSGTFGAVASNTVTVTGVGGVLMAQDSSGMASIGNLTQMFTLNAAVMTTGGATTDATFKGTIGTGTAGVVTDGGTSTIGITMDVRVALQATGTMTQGTFSISLGTGFSPSGAMAALAAGTGMGNTNVFISGQENMDFTFKVGTGTTATEDEITVGIGGITTSALGINDASVATREDADNASDSVSAAIDILQEKRSDVGAAQNRLDFAQQNVDLARENQEAARSQLQDLNVAEAITEFSQQQLLVQAGTSTLSQANNLPQNLLQLFN